MSKGKCVELEWALPEHLMVVRADAAAGVPIDAITTACERALAVLRLLSSQFRSDEAACIPPALVAGVLWDIEGTIEQIQTLALYGAATSTPDTCKDGAQ
ncbi:hypothetical protein D9M70_532170 [compost metagenome]